MHDLTKSYNRYYYWAIFKINVRMHWKMLKLKISALLCKAAFKLSPELEKQMYIAGGEFVMTHCAFQRDVH